MKTVIVGLDGVPYGMIERFAGDGVMPNTARLISQGIFKKMHSSIPEVSSVAWSSIITGENPGSHGIYGFMDLKPGSYTMRFPNFRDLKAPPFWDTWEGKSVIINVPSTYPVREMNGVLISGFVSIDFEKSVHPRTLVPDLLDLGYRLDVDSQQAHRSMELFLEDLDRVLNARIEAYRYLWGSLDWQTFMLVFTGTDRLMHFLWDAYENGDHRYHDVFREHFRKIDRAVGEISDRLNEGDLLIMISDHGFERLDKDVYISYLLMREGFLAFEEGADPALEHISRGTKAFVLDPARIYVNLKGRFPNGSVERSDVEGVLRRLDALFRSIEVDGRKVVRDVYRKEQIFSGPHLEHAPDMVMVGAEGFNLKANVKAARLADKAIFTGKHTQDSAFLAARGLPDAGIVPAVPVVSDVKGIVERCRA
jgi:predicted AlkP superfamily phosphohydrolase/phosphomutase